MPPRFSKHGPFVGHALEAKFNASGWDILSAIEMGFRAQVDVKGKLAEFFLHRHLKKLLRDGLLTKLEWRDKDGIADFLIETRGKELEMECKNVRSIKTKKKAGCCKVEIQKTRSQIGGGPKRGYKVDEFDVLAACLFNQTGKWEYLFAATVNLERRAEHADYLVVMQEVPFAPRAHWRKTTEEAINDALESKR